MSTETVSSAVAKRDTSPGAMVQQYKDEFAMVLPSHIKPETWVRLAVGLVRRDQKLALAAQANPASLMGALMEAARQGLEPGTDEFYLRPIKRKGRAEVQGITGYQGYIELMYRAGAVSSVVVEVVRTGDRFEYRPGRDARPLHDIDWDAEDRGELRLVYSYAIMKDGATSRVVVLNRKQIAKIREKSDSARSEYSPWNTNEEAMWLKSAARQLRKWVPTSAEYVREQLRAQAEVAAEQAPTMPGAVKPLGDAWVEAPSDDVVDAEFVDEDDQLLPDDPDRTAHEREGGQ